jgi:hypothetical protein
MYYRLKTSLHFNYPFDPALDKLLKDGLKSGLKSVATINKYEASAVFNNGMKLTYWNANKYYAWMNSACAELPSGNKYVFHDSRPSAKAMYMMIQALAKFDYK